MTMRIVVFISFLGLANCGLLDIFGGSSKNKEVHLTRVDTGELGSTNQNVNLGKSVELEDTHVGANHGSEIFIPSNTGVGSGAHANEKQTTTPRTRIFTTTRPPPTTTTQLRTTLRRFTITSPRTPLTRELPNQHIIHDDGKCPARIDAFTSGPSNSIIFDGRNVFLVNGKRISSVHPLSSIFPRGPSRVKAAVYDKDKELILLFNERTVYGYSTKSHSDARYELDPTYPKTLPETIAFSPNAAIRWHDGHQMVLSNGGKFALYDEYWNKSLMTGRTSNYFENLPDRVRGISKWENGRAFVFTETLVFEYDKERKGLVGDGIPLSDYIQC